MVRGYTYFHAPLLEVADCQELVEWLEGAVLDHLLAGPSQALQRVENSVRCAFEGLRGDVDDVLIRKALDVMSA